VKIVSILSLSLLGVAMQTSSRADELIVRHRLPASLAHRAVEVAVAACAKKGGTVSAAVVDADGAPQAVLRGDGAGIQTVQSALDKANTSAVYGLDSAFWVDRAGKGQDISPLLNHLPHLLLARGGLVIKIKGEVVGGIAVGGTPSGNTDEDCAREGLNFIVSALP
jgi:uncharacterized protein GlcG (DUF336 family)